MCHYKQEPIREVTKTDWVDYICRNFLERAESVRIHNIDLKQKNK